MTYEDRIRAAVKGTLKVSVEQEQEIEERVKATLSAGRKDIERKHAAKGRSFKDMSHEEIINRANGDRANGDGEYHMTGAMKEEQKRTWKAICERDQIYDE
jgi:hypothetical protein